MADYYLNLDNLTVGYNNKPLIRQISFGISKGEIVTLIGPNGSGKSTILKSIIGQLKLLGGTVFLNGHDLQTLSPQTLATQMAVMLTDKVKPELMTCYDVVATGRYPYTGRLGILSAQDKEIVSEALATVHAQDIADSYFNQISDGQRQRILLARVICQQPQIVILDEPTSFLDIRHKLELLSILQKMAKEKNMTIVMSLHEIDLAEKISHQILCVKKDYISHYGTPETIFQDNVIQELYSLDNGSFDTCFGSVELPRIKGKVQVLVISAGGSGIPIYRKLQKMGIPFAAAILYENDIDYHLAKRLAVKVITEKPFCEINDHTFDSAVSLMKDCPYVINAGFPVGSCNKRLSRLLEMAEHCKKLRTIDTLPL